MFPVEIAAEVLAMLYALDAGILMFRFTLSRDWIYLGKSLPRVFTAGVYLHFMLTGFVPSTVEQASLARDAIFLLGATSLAYNLMRVYQYFRLRRMMHNAANIR